MTWHFLAALHNDWRCSPDWRRYLRLPDRCAVPKGLVGGLPACLPASAPRPSPLALRIVLLRLVPLPLLLAHLQPWRGGAGGRGRYGLADRARQ